MQKQLTAHQLRKQLVTVKQQITAQRKVLQHSNNAAQQHKLATLQDAYGKLLQQRYPVN